MTTDNFNEAARAEAERVARENAPLEYGSIREAFVDAYAAGLQARTHLAAQEPTDGEVRAVMKVARTHYSTPVEIGPSFARAVLSAARATRRGKENR